MGGRSWTWRSGERGRAFFRIYHVDARTPDALHRRRFGPLARFDPHRPAVPPTVDPEGRSVVYVAESLSAAVAEVFAGTLRAAVCPSWRAAALTPMADALVQNLVGTGTRSIGAFPALCTGNEARELTQAWARAIYKDRPAGPTVCGVRYRGAHSEGRCLALWDTAPELAVIASDGGPQDLGLHLPPVWLRTVRGLRHLGVRAVKIQRDECALCRRPAE